MSNHKQTNRDLEEELQKLQTILEQWDYARIENYHKNNLIYHLSPWRGIIPRKLLI